MVRKLFTLLLGLGLVCIFCYSVPYVVFASLAVESMPFGREQGEAWLLGTPQPVFQGGISASSSSYVSGGPIKPCGPNDPLGCASAYPIWDGEQVPFVGYSMPPEYVCTQLVEDGVLWPNFGEQRYGCGPDGTRPCKRHSGVDIGSHGKPAPVYTPMGGLVVWADWDPQWYFGQFVAIEANGYQLIFAHLSRIDVVKGQIVHAGQQIGLTGTTGNSDGIHLHFEVRVWNGERWVPIDPMTAVLPGQYEYCDWHALMPNGW